MRQRLPLMLSATALVVAIFGATPLGNAARQLVQAIPPFAKNAGAVNGIKASRTPKPGYLLPLGSNGKFPASANSGESSFVLESTQVVVPPGQVADAFANCGSGHAAGGGGEVTGADSTSNAYIVVSEPNSNGTGWFLRVKNNDPVGRGIIASVICESP